MCFVIRKLECSVVTTLDVTTTQDRTPQSASATKDFSGTDTAVFTVLNSQVSEGSFCLSTSKTCAFAHRVISRYYSIPPD